GIALTDKRPSSRRRSAPAGGGVGFATVFGGAVCVTRGAGARRSGAKTRAVPGEASGCPRGKSGFGCASCFTVGAGSVEGGGAGGPPRRGQGPGGARRGLGRPARKGRVRLRLRLRGRRGGRRGGGGGGGRWRQRGGNSRGLGRAPHTPIERRGGGERRQGEPHTTRPEREHQPGRRGEAAAPTVRLGFVVHDHDGRPRPAPRVQGEQGGARSGPRARRRAPDRGDQ